MHLRLLDVVVRTELRYWNWHVEMLEMSNGW
jgi:hypothetical protein